jgi:putative transposase
MPVRKVQLVEGEYYHIYNRGNSRQLIYKTTQDYNRFMSLLYLSNGTKSFDYREIDQEQLYDLEIGEPLVAIGSYCLMPNHFHILLTPLIENGAVLFMRKLATGYAKYYNTKHHRTGSLFESRFKSEYVDSDTYLKYLFSYIHLNPIKLMQTDWQQVGIQDVTKAMQYLDNFKYSSYIDNDMVRPESNILNRSTFPEYFDTKKANDAELLEWLTYKEEPIS